ncbi:MAG: hypothetical protein ACKVZJ_12585 [Phycisphaerales bacterium]
MIVNGLNDEFSFAWTSPIYVGDPLGGGLTLFDLYTPTSADLGGGSAGLVPFAVHKTDCNPAQGSTVPPSGPGGNQYVRYYGPVGSSGGGDPLVISQRKVNAGSGDPTNNLASCFSLKLSTDQPTWAYFEMGNAFMPVGDYTVKANPGVLKNDILGTLTGDVRTGPDGELTFSVRWPCLGDLNGDNAVNTADLTLLLGQFGQSGPCGVSRDLDGDLGVNTADLTLFLGRFGTTCGSGRPGDPGTGSASAPIDTTALARDTATTGQGTRPGSGETGTATAHQSALPEAPAALPPVLAALGFTTIEGYTTWVNARTPAELNAHIVELLETIQQLEATP